MKTIFINPSKAFCTLFLLFIAHFNLRSQAAGALNFDGFDDQVSFSNSTWWNLGNNFTLEMWIKPNSTNNSIILYGGYGCVTCPQWVLGIGPELTCGYGGTSGRINFSTPAGVDVESDATVSTSAWTHVAVTYNGDIAKMYVNGILQINSSPTRSRARVSIANPSYMIMGRDPGCGGRLPYGGSLDEFRMWNTIRTQCEIQSYMNCEIPTTATNLLANFHFNSGTHNSNNSTFTSLVDASGNSTSGSLVNFSLNGTSSNWVAPGGVVNAYTTSSAPVVEINVQGNGTNIVNNDLIPSTADYTDFNGVLTRTFVIQNTISGGNLNSMIYFTGPNAYDFSVTTLPASIISGVGSTSFVVTLLTGGVKTATLNISNNDCDEPVYTIGISASATSASELNFDGVDDRILITNQIPYDFTIEYWMKTTQTFGSGPQWWYGGGIVDADVPGIHDDFGISLNGSKIAFGTGGDQTIFSTSDVNTGQWVHVAVTRVQSSGEVKLYINGILESTSFGNAGYLADPPAISIGRNLSNTNSYTGDLDELRIWNIVRTPCEILSNMNCEIVVPTDRLVSNFHFNQGVAAGTNTGTNLLIDLSGSYNNGNLDNFGLSGNTSNWINSGAVATDYSATSSSLAIIMSKGNSTTIANNDFTPSTADFTDFQTNSTRTFVIQNTGTGLLTLTNFTFTGAAGAEFSLTSISSTALATGATSSLVVAFTPSLAGLRTATFNILNTDCSTPLFKFAIQATAPPAAALSFDGVDDFINASNTNIPIGNSDFTYEFWVKIKSAQTGHRWISALGSAGTGSLMTIGYDGSAGNLIRIHHFGPDLIATTAAIPLNAWTHVAVNYRSNSFSHDIFINGVYVETLNFGAPLNIPANPSFQIGSFVSNYTYCPHMELDEFRIWNRTLCAGEIQNNMNCEIAANASGLVSVFHFNQGSASVDNTAITTVTDATSSANTGALVNFASTSTVSNWVAPGAVTTGSSCTVYLDAEITTLGNAITIPSGALTPTTSNGTDFGSLCSNSFIVKVFTIQNTGSAALTVSSLSMTGADAALFSISALNPSSPIAAGSTANFSVTLTPLTSGLKTATVNIASTDCDEALYTFVVSGNSNTLPIVSASSTNSLICNTASTSVLGSGADTYTWSGVIPANDGIAFNPSVTATYSLSGTNTLTGCTSTNSATQIITVISLPSVSISVPSGSICAGSSATLNASGADQYTWTPGPLNTTQINPSPVTTTGYTLAGTNTLTGCTSTNLAIQIITVNALPIVSVSAVSNSICAGDQATLSASGATSYTWQPVLLNGTTINPIPTTLTTYSVIGKDALGCISINTASQTIQLNPLPSVSITPLIASICVGGTASLSASGAVSYTWMPNALTGSTITPAPLNMATYTLIGKDANACTSTNVAVQTITVNALPTVTATTSHSLICNSGTTSLIGTGADTYTWSPNITNNIAFTPATTGSYTLSGTYTLTGCSSTNLAIQTISVNPSPTISLSAINITLCAGSAPTLTALNAASFTWTPGNYTTTSISPTLAATTVFTVIGASAAVCISFNTLTQTVTVNPLPVVTVSASNLAVCAGNTTSVFGGGAQTYTWTGGLTNAISFTPVATANYTVTGQDANGCQNTASITITVNQNPVIQANINSTVVCSGTSITLSGNGATSYTWSGGVIDGQAFAPTATQVYTLSGSNGTCTNTLTVVTSVIVNPLPNVVANVTNSVICLGNSSTLSGSGANTYTWSNAINNAVSFSPTITTQYTLSGEDSNGCLNTATAQITVNNLPTLNIVSTSSLVCEASNATLSVGGASNYTWSTNQTSAYILVTPTITTTYSVTGVDANGCINFSSYTQSVSPCLGTLTASSSFSNVTCGDKTDGKIIIAANQTYSNSTLSYLWSSNASCASNSCSSLENLPVGTYSVIVKATYTLNNILVKQDSIIITSIVISSDNGPCSVKIFNGVTANGDGINDTWTIDNISEYPKNKVSVFNRWGEKVYEVIGYNNIDKVWPTGSDLKNVGSNTYFYIIDLGNGSGPIKGWIDLSSN